MPSATESTVRRVSNKPRNRINTKKLMYDSHGRWWGSYDTVDEESIMCLYKGTLWGSIFK